jgi:competence protein ComEC
MEKCRLPIKLSVLSIITGVSLVLRCDFHGEETGTDGSLWFHVPDVGQGLAQMVTFRDTAIFFDVGPEEAGSSMQKAYRDLGKPYIGVIVISHDHLDHWGGLKAIDTAFNWSGKILVAPYEDTVTLKNALLGWTGPLTFGSITAGDSITLFENIPIRCIWPPQGLGDSVEATDDMKNRYSLVFKITRGETSALITSDIDSCSAQALSMTIGNELRSAIMVAPHHGSGAALSPLFYGYVRPQEAIISCAEYNSYGHPSKAVLIWFAQMGVQVSTTWAHATVSFGSNGYYWK